MATISGAGGREEPQEQLKSPRDSACASDLVKSSEDGKTDWKTLSNIMTANILGEVLCASYADYKYGRRTKNFKPDIEWRFCFEENDVLVFSKQHSVDQKVISFMGRSVIDLPVHSVAAILENLENFHLWNKFMIESRLVELLCESDSQRDRIGYFVHESKKCLIRTKRDMVLFIHSNRTADRYVQTAISVDHPSCPVVKNIIRAKCCLGSGWVVEAYEGKETKSLVSFLCNVDMKGLIPPMILNRFLQRQPLAIHYLGQCAMREEVHRQRPARLPFRKSRTPSESNRTNHLSGDTERASSVLSAEFTSNALGSFVFVNNSWRQYEDPVGISEFIGYHTTPRMRKNQRRRHMCHCHTEQQGGASAAAIFSSSSCEECGRSKESNLPTGSGSKGRYNNYMTR